MENDFAASVKEEFASMKAKLAKELRAELRGFVQVQQEIAKSSDALEAKRNVRLAVECCAPAPCSALVFLRCGNCGPKAAARAQGR